MKCLLCKKDKPSDHFISKRKGPPTKRCLTCREEGDRRHKEWHGKNPSYMKRYMQQRHYGITEEGFQHLYREQEGKCSICKTPESENTRDLAVDHDRVSGSIRGLLCGKCNCGIGMLNHDPALLREAIVYLERH